MYPSRAAARPPRHPAAVVEIPDCARGDRDAPRDSAGIGVAQPAAAQRARSARMDRGSTADHGCSVRKGPEERRNARSVAPHRAEAWKPTPKSWLPREHQRSCANQCCASRGCSYSNLKARSANSGPSSYWGLAIVPGVASSGRISGRGRLTAGPLEVVPDQAGGSTKTRSSANSGDNSAATAFSHGGRPPLAWSQ